MPVADLPYRITRLAADGQYAYLARPAVRAVKVRAEGTEVSKPKTPRVSATRLRVLRNVTLCDGPSLWESKAKEGDEPYAFFVNLRLFATRSMVADYLAGPEMASYSNATGTPIPSLTEGQQVITESDYLSEEAMAITKSEYERLLHSRTEDTTLESLEELVCQIQGIDSLESLDIPKRSRRKKTQPDAIVAVQAPVVDVCSDDDEVAANTTASDRPSAAVTEAKAPKKRRAKITLRDQFALVQNTPSRVIDVSGFGDTMQHQRGKVLDRVRHGERIAQCTSLGDLFPVISDNVPAFERAMVTLGSRYSAKIAEFKSAHAASKIVKLAH